jgi:hypothetical protein
MLPTPPRTSFVVEAIRRREAELADACAVAAASVKDTRVARRLVASAFEHLRHSRQHLDCSNSRAAAVDTGTLRRRAQRPLALWDGVLEPAIESTLPSVLPSIVDLALAGSLARCHAEVALFIDHACASLLVAPAERERLLRIAFCTAAIGDSLSGAAAPGAAETPPTTPSRIA